MKMKSVLFLVIFIVFPFLLWAQIPTQVIRGKVIDEDTQQPLIGANVQVLDSDPFIGTVTDLEGTFRLEEIPVGRVNLLVSFVGYQEKVIPNLEVNSAKEIVLDVSLVEAITNMKAYEVSATEHKGDALNDLAIVSARSVSPEQTSRFAGGFNDPSKITSNFAGVATSQDGGNEIIIRGNSPKYIQWRLEGAQISNPNHFGDQNAISGIVNALNNNLLSASDFYTGAFPAEFGDALSGVYDIRMRKGNNEKFEGIFGFGLLGTDITLEGPFKKGYDGSFLVNYRYSTIGLANELDVVEVDGANLNFQDATYKLWLPTKKVGVFSLFGLMGKSNFTFDEVDPGVWVSPGEDFVQTDITEDYDKAAFLFNTGFNHTINITAKSYLKTTFVYSQEGVTDEVYQNLSDSVQRLNFYSDLVKSAYRASTVYNYKLSARHKFNIGVRYSWINMEMEQSQLDDTDTRFTITDFNNGLASLRTFVNWRFNPVERITLVAGLHNTNVFYTKESTLEPRLAVNYQLSTSSTLSMSYGNHSRMESVHNYFATVQAEDGSASTPNHDLGLLRANHYVVGYEKYIGKNLRLKLEAYYQDLYNIPVENDVVSSYSTLNEGLELRYVDLVNEGTGKNYGVEFTFERFLDKGYYVLFNGSLYESKYTALDGVERNTQYNGNYLVNLLGGKTFSGLGKKNNREFSINGKVLLNGGRYYVPLLRDENGNLAVDAENGEVYDYSKAYEDKLDDIVNVTVSFSYKWNLKKTTHELYLNIDNLTNNRARLNEYYDTSEADGIGYERQVGIVPNFLYRFYF
tara:strand:- start:7034 stop:9430 length:2397 start_codon:yes stop_codon:yes gene_type:complete